MSEFHPCEIGALFALYDILNDDDEEIRDLGACVVSSLLNTSLVPLAASEALAARLMSSFGSTNTLLYPVICRITGSLTRREYAIQERTIVVAYELDSASEQLCEALKEDDALFVEEEQNLFIDEVREARLWSNLFGDAYAKSVAAGNPKVEVMSGLLSWTLDGLDELVHLTEKEDGPAGWSSKAQVFACCMRLLIVANTLLDAVMAPKALYQGPLVKEGEMVLDGYTASRIFTSMDTILMLGTENHIHPLLLSEISGQSFFTISEKERVAAALPKSTAFLRLRESGQQRHNP